MDTYRKINTFTGESSFIPFRYQGQYEDTETGLYYNRFRYYDCNDGRYISQDPIGLASGEFGFYNYVEDSNAWVDVFGLKKTYGDGFEMTSKKKTNKREGVRREDTFRRILEDIYGKDRVLSERLLLDSNGDKVKAGKRGKESGRRIDFIVLDENGNAMKSYEVTSKTANKRTQIVKEKTIRGNGGTYIKDRNGNLVDVSNVSTEIIRMK